MCLVSYNQRLQLVSSVNPSDLAIPQMWGWGLIVLCGLCVGLAAQRQQTDCRDVSVRSRKSRLFSFDRIIKCIILSLKGIE